MKKIISVILAGTMLGSLVALTGCGGGDGEGSVKIDETKSQLYVGNYDGGIGHVWLDNVIKDFETKYSGRSFEDGKTGVQVIVDNGKDEMAGSSVMNNMPKSRDAVFFTEGANYYDMIAQGLVADITDIVSQNNIDGESVTIESKMMDELVSYYKTSDNKYYALPFSEGYYGFTYNLDVLDENDLWLGETEGSYVGNNKAGNKSLGRDGVRGTDDDGLPATYSEFFDWLDKMVSSQVTPISWAGKVQSYTTRTLYSLWADYEGKEQFYLNYSFNGTAKTIVDRILNNGTVTVKEETINNQNGYLLQKQAGKYYALQFGQKIFTNSDYYKVSEVESHTDAQLTYLTSRFEGNPVALFVDGNWWMMEAESSGSFVDMEAEYGDRASKENSRYGFLPFPKFDESKTNNPRTMVSYNNTSCFVNSTAKGATLEIAKLFLQYCHSDEAMRTFTVATGLTKPYKYELTQTQEQGLNEFAKQMYTIHRRAHDANDTYVEMVYPFSNNAMWINNPSVFEANAWMFSTTVSGTPYSTPYTAFKSGVKLNDYFNGMVTTQEAKWSGLKNK